MVLIDTHAHAHFRAFASDMDQVIARSLERGMIINLVGTQQDTSRAAVATANRYEGVFASVGLHPEHLFSKHVAEEETSFQSREEDFDYNFYLELAVDPKTIAIGECGLDFYRIPESLTKEAMLPKQREVFLQHIKLAQESHLPMVIHCRDPVREPLVPYGAGAHDELIEILKNNPVAGTIHCYTSNWANAEQYLAMGFYIGFTGVITFPPLKKNPQAQVELLEVVQKMPLDRILLETDCPYLAPIPYRGQRCEPWMVEATAKKIAELRGISLSEVTEATAENAKRLFNKIV